MANSTKGGKKAPAAKTKKKTSRAKAPQSAPICCSAEDRSTTWVSAPPISSRFRTISILRC